MFQTNLYGEMKMNNEWYSFDDNQVDSYTDFTTGTYTEFNNRNYADNSSFVANNRNYVDFGTGYADFTNGTYTDLTEIRTGTPVKKKRIRARNTEKRARNAQKKASRAAKKAVKSKKKSVAGKVIFGTLAASVAVVAGTFLVKEGVVQACTETIIDEYYAITGDSKETAVSKGKKPIEEAFEITEECTAYDTSSPAYEMAQEIMADLWRDNDIDTAYEIFNWTHSNISYQSMTTYESFEEAAFNGFARRSGDCYVYFACSKMLLDIAGIPNLMVERYPVETNSHYWNLVQIDGLWYHCDATVFRDHPGMYFLLTDEEIDDGHHSFDSSLYPERASYYGGDDYWDDSYDVYYEDSYYDSYGEDSYYDPYYDNYDDPYYWDDSYIDYDEPYGGYGPNTDPNVDYEDYEYSYAPYEGVFMDSFEDAYVVNYDN